MKGRKFIKGLLWIIGIFFVLGVLGAGIAWGQVREQVFEGVQRGYTESLKLSKDTLDPERPTVIYDHKDKPILTLNQYSQYYRSLDEVNPYIKDGFVAVEDKRFYNHHGVDTFATIRAIVSIFQGTTQGGSTITQQLARNIILNDADVSANRKLAEMVVAQEMEKQFSKEEILTGYLNRSYFGNGAYGVAAAARRYFDKDQKDLSPKEAAMVINLTNNPSLYDPFTNPDKAEEKAKSTLKTMLANEVITQKVYDKWIDKPVKPKRGELVYDESFTDNYLIAYAIQKAAEQLAELDGFKLTYLFEDEKEYNQYHEQYRSAIQSKIDQITSGGYDIHTSIDLKLQSDLEDIVREVVAYQSDGFEVSVSVVDTSGQVVAMIGGRGDDIFNRSYLSRRQPGSTAKPLLVYAPAFEDGYQPTDYISDSEVPGYEYVTNWYGGFSNKDFTLRQALVQSLNNPTMNLAIRHAPDYMLNKLAMMEFQGLHPNDYTHVIALGGFTNGVSTLEMASAYATLANNGEFRSPTNLKQILNNQSNSVIYDSSHRPTKQVYTEAAAYVTTNIMKDVAEGPSVSGPVLADNYPKKFQGVKTGTTDENRDSYLVGVNAYYGIASWVGYDDNQSLTDEESDIVLQVNKRVSEYLLEDKEPVDFTQPDTVSQSGSDFIIQEQTEEDQEVEKTDYKENEDTNRLDSEEWNKSRIVEEEYRIVYGLSFDEERRREEAVVNKLEQIKNTPFENSKDYPHIQEGIAVIQEMITSVRNSRVKEDLQEDLDQFQIKISEKYSELERVSDLEKEVLASERIQSAKDSEKIIKQNKINALILEKDAVQYKIESYIKSGQDVTSLISELDEIIDKINRLGEPTGYYQIITDGVNVSFIEGPKPRLQEVAP